MRTRSTFVHDQLADIEDALRRGDWESAVKASHLSLEAAPSDPHALHAAARLFELASEPDNALTNWVNAVAIDPSIAQAWAAIGTVISRGEPIQNPHQFALLAFLQAHRADPVWLLPAWYATMTYHALGYPDAAAQMWRQCQRIIAEFGDHPKNGGITNWHNRSYMLMTMGQLEDGYRLYDFRLGDIGHMIGDRARNRPPAGVRRWTHGDPPPRLAVFVEQGAGDMLMTLPYVAALVRAGVEVTLEVFPSMSTLVRHRFVWADDENLTVIGQDAELPHEVDAYVWAMSLPGLMPLTTQMSFTPVFRLSSVQNPRNIAFAWQGSRSHRSDKIRSMPAELLEPIAAMCRDRGYTPIAVNPGEPVPAFLEDPGPIESFAETAAILDTCAAVVSVDTALVHLAGSLCVPTFAMLAALPDWRWGLSGHDNRWYPSVTLCRQPVIGDWSSVVAEVADHARALPSLEP